MFNSQTFTNFTKVYTKLKTCLKALEIYRKHFGYESVEVAEIRNDLGTIYSQFNEFEKTLEQNRLALNVMKKAGTSAPKLLKAELLNGGVLNELGRSEEAIEVLRGVASHAEAEGNDKAGAFNSMARAYFSLGKFDDAKEYMRTAQRIYENEEIDPSYVATGFEYMSMLYEDMNDCEAAISLSRRVLAIPKIPRKLLLDASTRLFAMVSSLAGKEEEAIPYMEDALERLKDSVGMKHVTVGYGYKVLGAAYRISSQLELAIEYLTKAQGIMDFCYGPDELNSLHTSHCLAQAYAVMDRWETASVIEEKVVEGLKKLLLGEQELLDEAVKVKLLDEAVELLTNLNKVKEIMAGPEGTLFYCLFHLNAI